MSDDLSKVDVLQTAVRRIIARCEAIEDENSTQLEREQTEASSGFLRGERHLAKSIRRELHNLTRNVAEPLDEQLAAKKSTIGLACGAVADAVFYHVSDHHHRAKLANALANLTRALERDSREG